MPGFAFDADRIAVPCNQIVHAHQSDPAALRRVSAPTTGNHDSTVSSGARRSVKLGFTCAVTTARARFQAYGVQRVSTVMLDGLLAT